MLTYPWKCTVLHCNHLGNTWKPLVLMTRHFDYCPSGSEDDNQSVRSSAPVVSRCFPGGYNVKLYISRGRLPWWLLAFLHSDCHWVYSSLPSPWSHNALRCSSVPQPTQLRTLLPMQRQLLSQLLTMLLQLAGPEIIAYMEISRVWGWT